ncbi:MAG TPA: hypothetical protein VHR72_07095, partial [Gemmataceae bacterium]|nr:hypothetical protein [Gemmataceae bacterium]
FPRLRRSTRGGIAFRFRQQEESLSRNVDDRSVSPQDIAAEQSIKRFVTLSSVALVEWGEIGCEDELLRNPNLADCEVVDETALRRTEGIVFPVEVEAFRLVDIEESAYRARVEHQGDLRFAALAGQLERSSLFSLERNQFEPVPLETGEKLAFKRSSRDGCIRIGGEFRQQEKASSGEIDDGRVLLEHVDSEHSVDRRFAGTRDVSVHVIQFAVLHCNLFGLERAEFEPVGPAVAQVRHHGAGRFPFKRHRLRPCAIQCRNGRPSVEHQRQFRFSASDRNGNISGRQSLCLNPYIAGLLQRREQVAVSALPYGERHGAEKQKCDRKAVSSRHRVPSSPAVGCQFARANRNASIGATPAEKRGDAGDVSAESPSNANWQLVPQRGRLPALSERRRSTVSHMATQNRGDGPR